MKLRLKDGKQGYALSLDAPKIEYPSINVLNRLTENGGSEFLTIFAETAKALGTDHMTFEAELMIFEASEDSTQSDEVMDNYMSKMSSFGLDFRMVEQNEYDQRVVHHFGRDSSTVH
jgi:hypothetical protein